MVKFRWVDRRGRWKVKEIRIYIEGGGDYKNTKKLIKEGFARFLQPIADTASSPKIKWDIIIGGTYNHAFRDFKNAFKSYADTFDLSFLDGETPVKINSPWEHLKARDNWDEPVVVDDHNCHLILQTMEAWFIADIATLKKFYRQDFKENSIPKNANVEIISKDILEPTLKTATGSTTKGEYHKIKHAYKLLELLDVAKVCQASPYCDHLFTISVSKRTGLINDTERK
ncbi:DUF4276 family protein [Trichormus azollae]|uniref:DUF4276 family protein n=1 Tax=Nostoc azollae (strain 0708) TaxID=551115 RepID=D7E4G0_NOSA0|nr:DUF4276 family protein [Trichormus azollae]ADI63718.1 conserved hypothetical protein ['Nostoc azollae' 0708]